MIYKLTRDGETPHSFYSRCNGKGTNIIFIRNYSNGYKFDGFTTVQLDLEIILIKEQQKHSFFFK